MLEQKQTHQQAEGNFNSTEVATHTINVYSATEQYYPDGSAPPGYARDSEPNTPSSFPQASTTQQNILQQVPSAPPPSYSTATSAAIPPVQHTSYAPPINFTSAAVYPPTSHHTNTSSDQYTDVRLEDEPSAPTDPSSV
eukprot:CFRG2344T1